MEDLNENSMTYEVDPLEATSSIASTQGKYVWKMFYLLCNCYKGSLLIWYHLIVAETDSEAMEEGKIVLALPTLETSSGSAILPMQQLQQPLLSTASNSTAIQSNFLQWQNPYFVSTCTIWSILMYLKFHIVSNDV